MQTYTLLLKSYYYTIMKNNIILRSTFSGNGPTVILIPGMCGSDRYYTDTVKALHKEGRSTLTIDLLGFGRSPKPKNLEYTLADHTQAMFNTIDSHNLTHPVTIVGVSMATIIIVDMIRRRPDYFSKAVYISPMIYSSQEVAETLSYRTGGLEFLLRNKPLAWVVCNTVCKIKPLAKLVYRKSNTNNFSLDIVYDAILHNWQSYSRSMKNVILNQDCADDFLASPIETIAIYGAQDRAMERNFLDTVSSAENNVTCVESHANHHPLLDDLDTTIGFIL